MLNHYSALSCLRCHVLLRNRRLL